MRGMGRLGRAACELTCSLLVFGGALGLAGKGIAATSPRQGTVGDPALVPKDRVSLWNGRDLSGWTTFLGDPTVAPGSVWRASEGVLRLDTKANGYLRTERSFANYRLHVEWRWPKDAAPNSNSGVMVHLHGPDVIWPASFEAQLRAGNAGQVVGLGLDIPAAATVNNRKRAPRLAEPSEKAFGEWNTNEIDCRAGSIEVFVNRVRQNHVEGLTVAAGAIALQMEGFPIEFREVWLEPLP